MRAYVEVTLLGHGVPYEALIKATDDQVVRWYAVISEASEAENKRINGMMEQG